MNLFKFFCRPKPIIFVGARNCIKLIQYIAEDCGYEVIGILDKYYYGNTTDIAGIPIIGSEEQLLDPSDKQAIKWKKTCAFALTSWWDGRQYLGGHGLDNEIVRLERANLLDRAGVNCPNLIHPNSTWYGRLANARLGKGIIISGECAFGVDIEIGDYSFIEFGVFLHNEVKIGRNSSISGWAGLAHTEIGNNVRVGPGVWCVPTKPARKLLTSPKITVGDNSVLWINSKVYDSVPADSIHTTDGRILKRFEKR